MSAAPVIDFEALLKPKVEFRLYNPCPEPVEQDFDSWTYVIPAKGFLEIAGRPSHPHPDPRLKGSPGYRDFPIEAKDIVKHLVGEDGRSGKLGQRGVRVLFGDSRDEAVIAEADAAAAEWQYRCDLQTEYAHNKSNTNLKEQGIAPAPPSARVQDAIRRRVEYEKGNNTRATHPCPECEWPFYSEQEVSSHIESTHKRAVVSAPVSGGADVAALEAKVELLTRLLTAPKAKRGRKKSEPQAEG